MQKVILLCSLLAVAGLAVAADGTPDASPDVGETYRVAPVYPPAALAARFEGAVILAAVVREDGTVGEVQVLDSLRPKLGFEQAAIDAMKQWRFEPARKNGDPVDSVAAYQLTFQLPGYGRGTPPIVTNEMLGSAFLDGLAGKSGGSLDLGRAFAGSPAVPRGDVVTGHRFKIKTPNYPRVCIGCMYDRRDVLPQPTRYRSTSD